MEEEIKRLEKAIGEIEEYNKRQREVDELIKQKGVKATAIAIIAAVIIIPAAITAAIVAIALKGV